MKQTTRIICITLCVLLIALSAAGVIWALYNKFASNEAHADYEDLAGTDTLVNFNQIAVASHYNYNNYGLQLTTSNNVITLNGTPQFELTFDMGTINIVGLHKYYYFNDCDTVSYKFKDIQTIENRSIYTQNSNSTITSQIIVYVNNYSNTKVHLNLIDLTLMFGAGNEPTVEQANEYFTADYYNYNTGTPIPYSKDYLQGYTDGANDLYDSMSITYNAYTIGSTSTTYANNTVERGELIFDQQVGAYMFSGVIGVNLMGTVERGTTFSINFDLYIPDLQGESSTFAASFLLHFGIVQNNELIEIIAITPIPLTSSNTNTYTGDFQLTQTTDTVYIWVDYNRVGSNTSPTQCFAFNSEMTFKSTDMGLLMNNSYQRGYNAAAASYYQGTENYNAIYNLGYQNGLSAQNATLGAMEYIGAAFTGIGSILQIELLPGVPFSLFILLPLMFGLIAFVVKLSKGGD